MSSSRGFASLAPERRKALSIAAKAARRRRAAESDEELEEDHHYELRDYDHTRRTTRSFSPSDYPTSRELALKKLRTAKEPSIQRRSSSKRSDEKRPSRRTARSDEELSSEDESYLPDSDLDEREYARRKGRSSEIKRRYDLRDYDHTLHRVKTYSPSDFLPHHGETSDEEQESRQSRRKKSAAPKTRTSTSSSSSRSRASRREPADLEHEEHHYNLRDYDHTLKHAEHFSPDDFESSYHHPKKFVVSNSRTRSSVPSRSSTAETESRKRRTLKRRDLSDDEAGAHSDDARATDEDDFVPLQRRKVYTHHPTTRSTGRLATSPGAKRTRLYY